MEAKVLVTKLWCWPPNMGMLDILPYNYCTISLLGGLWVLWLSVIIISAWMQGAYGSYTEVPNRWHRNSKYWRQQHIGNTWFPGLLLQNFSSLLLSSFKQWIREVNSLSIKTWTSRRHRQNSWPRGVYLGGVGGELGSPMSTIPSQAPEFHQKKCVSLEFGEPC